MNTNENNAREIELYNDGSHRCIMFSFDEEEQDARFLSVNQYLIIQNGIGVLIDPGSSSIFEPMYEAVTRYVAPDKIKYIFFSHQDPDVAGSITEWSVVTQATFIISELWVRFMAHYGIADLGRIKPLPDKGTRISFGTDALELIPAHFLHSPGNFSLYDTRSKILFSGDIGAAIVPLEKLYKTVTDFESHMAYLEPFHTRYMGSNRACRAWCMALDAKPIHIMAPQHGALLYDADVTRFITWFETLTCGSDLL